MTLFVSNGSSAINADWENLCLETGHFLASRYNDEVNKIFRAQPYIIYVLDDDNKMLGGCKLHVTDSRLLPSFIRSISRTVKQNGEYVIKNGLDEATEKKIIALINQGFTKFLKEKDVTKLIITGFYGNINRLYDIENLPGKIMVNVGLIDLTLSVEELWDNLHSKHRNVIRKAENDNVLIESTDDIDTLINVLNDTFTRQEGMHGPSADFLRAFYKIVKAHAYSPIFKAYYNGELCGAACILGYGPLAYYSFSGSNKVHNGANTLMQWHIIKDLKAKGYKTYSMGNIAYEGVKYDNEKFEDGISRFKVRFGTELHPTFVADFTLSPFKNKVWKAILKQYNRFKKS